MPVNNSRSKADEAINRVMGASYGRLLAGLCARFTDVQACEDALAHAFSTAIEHWNQSEIPKNPEAWIFKVAKNKLIDTKRREKHFANIEVDLSQLNDELSEQEHDAFPDERLKLLFVCAHPSIDESVRTPLMLQTVLGLEASQIASAFLTSPEAMTKKLVRAKQKIKLAGIDFAIPERGHLFERTEFVAEAIYAIYGKSWDDFSSPDSTSSDLDKEAIYLAELLTELLPNQPEAKGLLAVILFCESRKSARQTKGGDFIPLDEQDPELWNFDLISRADGLLHEAFHFGQIGRFQIEAAIQSAHTARIHSKIQNWDAILSLYDGLIACAPTIGAVVSRASALSRLKNSAEGLKALDEIPPDLSRSYQPYWALRASLLSDVGEAALAQAAYDLAIGLSQNESVRRFLTKKKERLR